MSSYKAIIPITPKPKGSVRMSRGHAYNPSSRGMIEITRYMQQKLEGKPVPLLKGPLLVILHFVLPVYVSMPQIRRDPQNLLPHIRKPDGDNLEKFLNDSLTGVIWEDDAQITWMLRSKTLTNEKRGYTVFYAQEIANAEPDYKELLKVISKNIYIKKGEENYVHDV